MENRSHALMAGTFTLVLLLAAAAVAFWIGRDRGAVSVYELVSEMSVNGLSTQSAVRYQGVPVGKVQSLRFDPERPGTVRIRIGVGRDTPVSSTTWAELGVRGVTGLSVVELRDDGSPSTRLQTSEESPATIPIRPGLFQKLEERGTAIMDSVEKITAQVNKLVSDDNIGTLQTTMNSLAGLAASLEKSAKSMQPAMDRAGPLMDALTRATGQADAMARDVGELTRAARQALARLQADGGALDMATRSMNELSWAVSRIGNDAVPRLSGMADDVGSAARRLNGTLQSVEDRPQSFIFGPAPVRAGPGEPGFEGFRKTR